jgi:hypothetical protein
MGAEPTEYEQYCLELINRARANPAAEVQRAVANSVTKPGTFVESFTPFPGPPSINEGPPVLGGGVYTIPPEAKQPLAFNVQLIDVTRSYAAVCQGFNDISHTFNGTTPPGRMSAGGYPSALPVSDGLAVPPGSAQVHYPGNENAGQLLSSYPWAQAGYPGDRKREAIEALHHAFFVDGAVPGRGHRITMMARDFREIGVGVDFGTDPGWASAYVVMNLGHQTSRGPFLTGVVFREVVGDGFYTPGRGEALGGVGVSVRRTGTATEVASTSTFASGGFAVMVPPDGTYDVVFAGAGVERTIRAVAVGSLNVKVDVVEPPVAGGFDITSITRTGGGVTVTWRATPGARYRVVVSADGVVWSPVPNSEQTAASSSLSHVDPAAGGAGRKFYRIERL